MDKHERVFQQIGKKMRLFLRAHLLGHVQYTSPFAEKRGRPSRRNSRAGIRVKRCPQPGFNMMAMTNTNPVRFPCIGERGFLAHERGFPFLPTP
jgi:hypothetical protein